MLRIAVTLFFFCIMALIAGMAYRMATRCVYDEFNTKFHALQQYFRSKLNTITSSTTEEELGKLLSDHRKSIIELDKKYDSQLTICKIQYGISIWIAIFLAFTWWDLTKFS